MIRKPEAGCDAFFRLVPLYNIFRVSLPTDILITLNVTSPSLSGTKISPRSKGISDTVLKRS